MIDFSSNPFVLAPMAGITDMPFRRLMKKMGAGVVVSEFVSAHAIVHGGPRVEKYLAYHIDERPVGIQIFGGDEEILINAAKKVESRGLDFVDLNLGCPVPKVTKKGGGSAWLCHPLDLGKLLGRIKKSLTIPFTIKIRTGWDAEKINVLEIVQIAESEGVDAVFIHGRTRAQGYSGLADWHLISRAAQTVKIPIIGNGDIVSGPLAVARLQNSGCRAVMIGRGALKNPWIFSEANEALEKSKQLSEAERATLHETVFKHHKLPPAGDVPPGASYYDRKVKRLQPLPVSFSAEWIRIRADRDARQLIQFHLNYLRDFYPEERVMFGFRKFLAWYSAGYPGSHNFRKFIFNHENFEEVIQKALDFFDSVKQLGTSGDDERESAPVLMGGHG
jgi:nifR3 family TIM-barrel protein